MSFESIDIAILKFINGERLRELDGFFTFITNSGPIIAALIPIGFILIGVLRKQNHLWQSGILIGIPYLLSILISQILKAAVIRPRPFITYPFIEKLSGGGSSSFPSGHTSDVFSIAVIVCLLYPKRIVIIPLLLWASLVGYSRMDLGVHFPSDVLAGALIGAVCSVFCYWWYKRSRFSRLISLHSEVH